MYICIKGERVIIACVDFIILRHGQHRLTDTLMLESQDRMLFRLQLQCQPSFLLHKLQIMSVRPIW